MESLTRSYGKIPVSPGNEYSQQMDKKIGMWWRLHLKLHCNCNLELVVRLHFAQLRFRGSAGWSVPSCLTLLTVKRASCEYRRTCNHRADLWTSKQKELTEIRVLFFALLQLQSFRRHQIKSYSTRQFPTIDPFRSGLLLNRRGDVNHRKARLCTLSLSANATDSLFLHSSHYFPRFRKRRVRRANSLIKFCVDW